MQKTMLLTLSMILLVGLALFLWSCKLQKGEPQENDTSIRVNPQDWPEIKSLPLDPKIEAQIDEILPMLTLEQKVGQVIQADSESVSPEEVKKYRLGSVLSGGNSAPGSLPYADTKSWLEMADKYYNASIDTEGVEIAIPCIWGIDAVHGHANLSGAIIFPHNIGLGAMNNPDLIEKIAEVTAHELTVSGHDWTFAPTLAAPQDLRWGRSYEGYSDRGDIINAYAERIVKGLQGHLDADDFMGDGRVLSCAKHFLADGATEKGVDQGDAKITEKELIDLHASGYYSAIPAGVQTVMASFSSWNGSKLHGDKELLTDVLKERLGFTGFVVGDWNGHGQLPGSTNTDCPAALIAGLDMYMAPDSWKGLYKSTLKHAKKGTIPMSRLDDAVRRILRVKLAMGIFDKGAPSTRKNAGDQGLLGLPENRAIARQAVRESMVLLKNNDKLLPLDASKTILVIGDGANSISKVCGGWTLSWQGTGHKNDEFPNGETVLSGIKEAVAAKGGKVIFSENGNTDVDADVVIAVYGEDPYAEFQGDRPTLDFMPKGFDVKKLSDFKTKGIPVVSVFLSGRPLWCNPEINQSDAFIAAWLPGSEGGGVSDLLFQRDSDFDFTGKLSFSWPSTSVAMDGSDPLFGYGYGLTYKDDVEVAALSEYSGLDSRVVVSTGEFFGKGKATAPWELWASLGTLDKQLVSFPTSMGGMIVSKIDHLAQEDALRVRWVEDHKDILHLRSRNADNMARQTNGDMAITFWAKSFGEEPTLVEIGMCDSGIKCDKSVSLDIVSNEWKKYYISLKCFAELGVDMDNIMSAFVISASKGVDVGLNDIKLETVAKAKMDCD